MKPDEHPNTPALPGKKKRTGRLNKLYINMSVRINFGQPLESQEEDALRRVLWSKPMSWLGQIRPHHKDETWSAERSGRPFCVVSVGTQNPTLTKIPISGCGWKKFQTYFLGDHLCTCITHSGVKKAHDWVTDQIVDLFHTTHKVKTQLVTRIRGQ